MQKIINGFSVMLGMLAFCGLLAWIESVPMPDSAMDYFVAAGTAVLNFIQEVAR